MTEILCRVCEDYKPASTVPDWTRREQDSDNDAGVAVNRVDGQCEDCLENDGPDEHCTVPEEQDEAYARAEAEYRNLDRGEL